jgi:hypothetical protein
MTVPNNEIVPADESAQTTKDAGLKGCVWKQTTQDEKEKLLTSASPRDL